MRIDGEPDRDGFGRPLPRMVPQDPQAVEDEREVREAFRAQRLKQRVERARREVASWPPSLRRAAEGRYTSQTWEPPPD